MNAAGIQHLLRGFPTEARYLSRFRPNCKAFAAASWQVGFDVSRSAKGGDAQRRDHGDEGGRQIPVFAAQFVPPSYSGVPTQNSRALCKSHFSTDRRLHEVISGESR